MKALQVRIESAMFESKDCKYFIVVTIEGGVRIQCVNFYIGQEEDRDFNSNCKPNIQREQIQFPYSL